MRLTRRRCRRLLRSVASSPRIAVERHPQFGRNRLFVAKAAGRRILVKQFRERDAFLSEVAALSSLSGHLSLPAVVSTWPDIACVAYGYEHPDTTLERACASDVAGVLRSLSILGASLVAASGRVAPPERRLPLLVREIIRRGPASRTLSAPAHLLFSQLPASVLAALDELDPESGPLEWAHGDLKLDNVLQTQDGPVPIDWEFFCAAPRGWNVASACGAMFIACTRATSGPMFDEAHRRATALMYGAARAYGVPAGTEMRGFVERLMRMAGVYVVDRVVSEAMHRSLPHPMDAVLSGVAAYLVDAKAPS